MADFSGHVLHAELRSIAGGDALGGLENFRHAAFDLICDAGNELTEGGEFFALREMGFEAIDAAIGFGKALERLEEAAGKDVFLHRKQESDDEDGEEGDSQAESAKLRGSGSAEQEPKADDGSGKRDEHGEMLGEEGGGG